jgi:hypothetical protein
MGENEHVIGSEEGLLFLYQLGGFHPPEEKSSQTPIVPLCAPPIPMAPPMTVYASLLNRPGHC